MASPYTNATLVDHTATHSYVTLSVIGCKVCKNITAGRCPWCEQAAYCSNVCFAKDIVSHSAVCPGKTTRPPLNVFNPLTDFQRLYPAQWASVITAIRSDSRTANNFIFLYAKDGMIRFVSFSGAKLLDNTKDGQCTVMFESFRSKKPEQACIVVVAPDCSLYYTRLSLTSL